MVHEPRKAGNTAICGERLDGLIELAFLSSFVAATTFEKFGRTAVVVPELFLEESVK